MSHRNLDRVRDRHRDHDHHFHRRRHLDESSPKRRRSALAAESPGYEERRQLRAHDRNSSKTLIPPESDSSFPKSSNGRQTENRKRLSSSRRGDGENNRKFEDPSQIPRSLSYFQHDERSDAGQMGRSFGRRTGKDYQSREEKDERLREGNSVWRHDGFFEQQDEQVPMVRKRPAFREKKDDESGSALGTQKSHYGHRVREISRGQHGYKGQSFMGDERDVRRGNFAERDGYNRNKERFMEFNTSGDKWKHDLFEENFTKINEEEQIANIEELLTS